jgi:hypothetical protein
MSRKYSLHYPAPRVRSLHGRPKLPTYRGTVQLVFGRERLRRIFKATVAHGIFVILVAALISATGQFDILIRSVGIFLCVLWLTVDVGVWLSERKSRLWQHLAASCFSFAFCVFSCVGMLLMHLFLSSALQDQRDNVFNNLISNHYVPPGDEDDPMNSMFTVTNNSIYQISQKHQIVCRTNMAVGNGGRVLESNEPIFSAEENGFMQIGYQLAPFLIPASSTLAAGGDAQTDECLAFLHFGYGADCVDVTVIFWYALESQPDFEQLKEFRYYAPKGKDGRFDWYQEPQNDSISHCLAYYKPVPPNGTSTQPRSDP